MSEYQQHCQQPPPNPYVHAAPRHRTIRRPGITRCRVRPHALANLRMRLVARLLDLVFVLVAMIVVGGALATATLLGAGGGDTHGVEGLVGGVGALLAVLLYEPLLVHRYGATFGKRICRLRVARIADGGNPALGAAFVRWIIYVACNSVLFVGTINTLSCLWDKPYRQCWHDKAADSVVVRRDACQ
ncbi:RDD family protein [Streptomyces sp. ET3-23]|uniref:RDD family protein n=1 Tax=Streptomyces sp. ET3-23 TaxID=2885643 RepID=UPI001D100CC3|nr:RDD family protein [Streptomyces sp. ET3-23]MCC2278570.1 RDD family protein [Streptomyces sp. ET3-23]